MRCVDSGKSKGAKAGLDSNAGTPSIEDMERALVIIARAMWLLMFFQWVWAVSHGTLVNPLHPFNIAAVSALMVGVVPIWVNRPWARVTAGVAGIVFSALCGFQCFVLLSMFTPSTTGTAHFEAAFGPFTFEGAAAKSVAFGPIILLAVVSGILLLGPLDRTDRKNEWRP